MPGLAMLSSVKGTSDSRLLRALEHREVLGRGAGRSGGHSEGKAG
jgi:hypothetical protein